MFYFRIFGCKCYILRKDIRLSNFQSRCDVGFLLGYSSNSKVYRILNKNSGFVKKLMMLLTQKRQQHVILGLWGPVRINGGEVPGVPVNLTL